MRITAVLFAALTALPALSQEAVVSKASIWPDTVKRGEMLRQVRGLGEIKNRRTVALRIAETQVKEIRVGREVSIDARQTHVGGQGHAGRFVHLEWSGHCGRAADCPAPAGTETWT
jgi:hypothetical protein